MADVQITEKNLVVHWLAGLPHLYGMLLTDFETSPEVPKWKWLQRDCYMKKRKGNTSDIGGGVPLLSDALTKEQ